MTALTTNPLHALHPPPCINRGLQAWVHPPTLVKQPECTPLRPYTQGEPGIPATVLDLALDNDWSAARAWREYFALTPGQVAKQIGLSETAYFELESQQNIHQAQRDRLAQALGLVASQLDF